ncbi:hypothetical protein GQ42DRAFT_87696 [Ramicandelaber brevisporus]|nr:hypothetical protein GQ42DRAFT_87696 [Ramicandelaber brevisporus]
MHIDFPPSRVVATYRSKTIYTDLQVSSDATPEQILEAMAQKAIRLIESKRDARGGLHPYNFRYEIRGFYNTFSVIYDRYSRAAYDVFGDGLFAHFGIEYDCPSYNPAYYYDPPRGLEYLKSLSVLGIVIMIGTVIWGVITGEFLSLFERVFPVVFSLVFGVLNASGISSFIDQLAKAVNFTVGVLFGRCDYQNQNQSQSQNQQQEKEKENNQEKNQEKLDVPSTQVKASQMSLLRVFGFRLLLDHLMVYNRNMFTPIIITAMAIRGYSSLLLPQQQQQQEQQENNEQSGVEFSILVVLTVIQVILNYNERVRNNGLSKPHVSTLLHAMQTHTDSAYSAESDKLVREQLHSVIEKEYEGLQPMSFLMVYSPLLVITFFVICCVAYSSERLTLIVALIGHFSHGALYYILTLFATLILSQIVVTVKGWFSVKSDNDPVKQSE